MELSDSLLARIGEDEARAQMRIKRAQQNAQIIRDEWQATLGRLVPGWHDWPDLEADAHRLAADCEAKRRIVVRCQEMQTAAVPMAVHLATQTLTDLARPYAYHPAYDPAWRP